ncbi:MAG: DUF3656 domain-containing U32 family peptidase [Bacteroidota bacterium]
MELVAPAGEYDSFRLAIAHGADAVYLGGKEFSARQNAANFDQAQLEGAIRLAHLHRVRVYVAMNTLIRAEEMEAALAQARLVQAMGADAIIVQDLGFLIRLRESLPSLRIHASTQMTVTNAPTLRVLARLGVARAVLAREAGADEIKAMAEAGPEIEVFAHGALCYCYSGQCLMSSLIGGRSGNRGRCAQPCRMEYGLRGPSGPDLGAEAGRYLLSPRDLCLLPHLSVLRAAGVHALKIEGRMKRPEYVGTVVRVYRQALDRLRSAPESFAPRRDELRDLEQIFNRGFTPGFFLGDQGLAYQSCRRPNNRGLPVGRVVAVDPARGTLDLALSERLHIGDGIEFWVSTGGRVGMTVARMEAGGRPAEIGERGETVTIPWRENVRRGDRVFRTSDAALQARAWAPLTEGGGPRLPFWAEIRFERGRPAELKLFDDEGHQAAAASASPCQPAKNRPLDEAIVRDHIGRTGGTSWRAAEIEVKLPPGIMLPLSELNRLRRTALAALEEARLRAYDSPGAGTAAAAPPVARPSVQESIGAGPISATVGTPDEAWAAMRAGANRLYLASWLHPWPSGDLRLLIEAAKKYRARIVLALPRVTRERDVSFWEGEMARALALGVDGLRVGDQGLADLAAPAWRGRLCYDFSLNVMNPWSLRQLALTAAVVTLSPELSLRQIKETAACCPGRSEVIAHGRLELMLSAHCLLGSVLGGKNEAGQACRRPCAQGEFALRDRMGLFFPLAPDRFCQLHVQNCMDLSVLPELDRIARVGCDLRLELHGRGPRYAAAVVGAYRRGLRALADNAWTRAQGEEAEASLAAFSPAGFTRGHFFRGVE